MISKNTEQEGIECTNPKLENIQQGNVMPENARACHYYSPLPEKKKDE
ncbi:MAG: hypothetical protein KAS32_06055 [Candidatus Peribacteraceae bacterium]|nr:hypothetical protein [Candidatus Peribacteraceae bacterium]